MILGADFFPQVIKPNIIRGLATEPIAQLSLFGWLISAPMCCNHSVSLFSQSHHVVSISDTQLQDLLTKFWVQEEVPLNSDHALTPEKEEREQHFKEIHSRDPSGRYVVRIPLKNFASLLGESQQRAQACFKRDSSRIQRDPDYGKLYVDFMDEYLALGHMRPISLDHLSRTPHYYLPHHGVLKKDGDTSKIRVVFNGSALTSSVFSVNSITHTGPNLLANIMDVILWLRSFQWTFSTDISKMYQQVDVHSDDWDLQRIISKDKTQRDTYFHLTTVT
ncbi:uncharacterized protein LOC106645346 [Copidosoma floridanum]|uniref:uncharacterized protein LOC106645346 n=1 Tax=Copidosoma floridanum TaxID=29053 RepID=UPI0006C98BF8|nr:uncharacterized protein LOC106645346 [Copidosoma floridanum]